MSKKLFYGGTEVIPCDPRLPEILANIIEMMQNAGHEWFREQHYTDPLTGVPTTTRSVIHIPGRCVEVTEEDVDKNLIDSSAPVSHITSFNYRGTLYPNHQGCTIADCLNQPGFKVVDNED